MATRQESVVVPIVRRLETTYHATTIEGLVYIFDQGQGHAWGKSAVDDVVVHLDITTTTRDRAEIYDLLVHDAPKGTFADPRFVGFSNGDLDVSTLELLPPAPERIIPARIPWPWVPHATSEAVEDYLDSTANGVPSTRSRIEEMAGACLYRGRVGLIFLLLGYAPIEGGTASNGKSTLIEVIAKLVGEDHVCQLSLNTIGRPFMVHNLLNTLMYAPDDPSSDRVPAESLEIVKKLATCQRLDADVKYSRAPVCFRPAATPVLAVNRIPKGIASDDGLCRRLTPVVLTGTFPEGGADPVRALDNEGDMASLAVIAVNGLRRLLDQGITPSCDSDVAADRAATSDSAVALWADDEGVDEATLAGTTCKEAYGRFARWASGAGIERPLPRVAFETEAAEAFPGLEVRKARWNGSTPQRRWMPRR